MTDYLKLENKVIEITAEAAALVRAADFQIHQKGTLDIVTSNDLLVQHFLQEKLSALLPGSGFYCEEENIRELNREYVWVIDPIDGTANYARGIDFCVISVGLLHHGQAVVGVVRYIFKEEVYAAALGSGARKNGLPIHVSDKPFEDSLFCTAMSLYKKEFAPVCNQIIFDTYMKCNDVRRFGSCAAELCFMAEGKCELYFELRIFPWDYAASLLILQEAGGVLRGFADEELAFNKPTVLVGANSMENYRILADIVGKHLKSVPYEE